MQTNKEREKEPRETKRERERERGEKREREREREREEREREVVAITRKIRSGNCRCQKEKLNCCAFLEKVVGYKTKRLHHSFQQHHLIKLWFFSWWQ